jgi:hypothetical protein
MDGMTCPVGRTFDANHATCRSCPVACQKPRKVRQAGNAGPAGQGRWMTTLDLSSPNEWTNKKNGRMIYQSIKRQWQKALRGTIFHLGAAKGRRRVEIVRYAANPAHLMDKDNAYAGCKPLLDCLTAAGIIIDDGPEYIELSVRQEIGEARVEITVTSLGDSGELADDHDAMNHG